MIPLVPTDLLFSREQRALLDRIAMAVHRGELSTPRIKIVLTFEAPKPARKKAPGRAPAA